MANADGNIVNFKTHYNYLLRPANPATTFNIRGEWMTAFESETTKTINIPNTYGIYIRNSIGNYNYQNEDLQITGKGLPLNITRSYNSGAAKNDGPFGYGWTHNYNLSQSVGVNGIVNVSTEDGRVDAFVLGPDNTYTPFPGVFDELIKNGDGTWTLKRTNRTALYFNTVGTLTKITDKNGNTMTFTYDTNKRLTKVTDAGGRSLTIAYDADGHITTVTDPANRQHKYTYTGGNLTAYTDPAGGVISTCSKPTCPTANLPLTLIIRMGCPRPLPTPTATHPLTLITATAI